jgi:hypothetical protein
VCKYKIPFLCCDLSTIFKCILKYENSHEITLAVYLHEELAIYSKVFLVGWILAISWFSIDMFTTKNVGMEE